ncbi:hypothetical protein [Saccharopolyspora rosea]|uniref:Uncharacterized protein n=1 Tax=Saccharopolyspora rosea TaxID=524884 RepID=A0ABW3FR17_9PSEU|nr:hypothetical protein [Saccharopolyspora rosea]
MRLPLLRPADLTAEQQPLYRAFEAMVEARSTRASRIGVEGIVDVTVLMGWFTSVALTLAAFDAPSNAVGRDQ